LRQLSQREQSFATVSLDVFFTQAAQETQAVILDSLGAALMPELTGLAVIVEHKRRLIPVHLHNVLKQVLRRLKACREPHNGGPALAPMKDNTIAWHLALNTGQQETEHL
jgi:hypothetical protein